MAGQNNDPPPTEHPAIEVLDVLSKKWHPVVVLELFECEPRGFNDLVDAIPHLSGKVLSGALEDLSEAGIVERNVINESPLRVEYELTEAGRAMEPIFAELEAWWREYIDAPSPTVLVADGDPRITSMLAGWLGDCYDVIHAHDGEAVRDHLHDGLDVLMLERSLPGEDAEELIESTPTDCRIVLCLGERPGLDLLELDCDDVLQKPVVKDSAVEAVQRQLERSGQPKAERERAALDAKCALLESVHPTDTLTESGEYARASDRVESFEDSLES